MTDMWHRRKCEFCKVDPAAILAAHNNRIRAEARSEALEEVLSRFERDSIKDDGLRYGIAVAAKWVRELAREVKP